MANHARALGILLLTIACSDSASGPAEAVELTAESPASQQVVAGNNVAAVPTVTARDRSGAPVAGVVITFKVEGGAGRIGGSVDTTNSAGVAQLRAWVVGTKAGETDIVSAAMSNGKAISFAANVVAGPVAKIVKLSGDDQIAAVNSQARINPRIMVTDGYDNPLGGQLVKFLITQGGGSLTTTETVTDSIGSAAVVWTMGTAGDQTLMITAASVVQVFHATAVLSLGACLQPTSLTADATVAGELLGGTCSRGGMYYTNYYFTTRFDAAWAIEMHSSAFDTYLELRDINPRLIAFNDNFLNRAKDSRIIAWLPAGTYQVVALSNTPNVGGPFQLSLMRGMPGPVGCEGLWVTRGAVSAGQVHELTCNDTPIGAADLYRMHLDEGETVLIHLQDRSYDGFAITVMDQEGNVLAKDEPGATYLDYVARYAADKDIDIVIKISSYDWGEYSIDFH